MDQDNQVNEYRHYLLGLLSEQAIRRPYEDQPGHCQVLVNHERVGTLDCTAVEPTFTFSSREQVVSQLEIRSEDGTVLGVLSAPEFGFKTTHIQLGRHDLELMIHNRLQGGTATATFKAAPSRPKVGLERRAHGRGGAGEPHSFSTREKVMVCAQVVLFVAVGGLVADRLFGSSVLHTPGSVSSMAAQPVAQGDIDRLEARLVELSRSHETAVETVRLQQQELGRLRQAVSVLGSTHRDMKAKITTAQGTGKPLGRRDIQREVETMAEMLIGRADADQEQLRGEIRGLALANEKLAKQLAALEASNQELKSRLKSAGVDVSKARAVGEPPSSVAQQPGAGGTVQLAEKLPAGPHNPTLFWVTFQDGTTEQHIDQFVKEIHGRRGQRRAEWTSLEVDLPDPSNQAGFLETLRKNSFVKAVAMKLDAPPAP